MQKETFFPFFFSFDASNPSKESRKVSVFHSYDKKHKSHFSTTFSYWKMFVFISALKMFVFISVFPSNYDTFNESLPLSVKQSRWFYKPMGSKGSQALGVRQLSTSSEIKVSEIKKMPLAGRETAAYKEGRGGTAMWTTVSYWQGWRQTQVLLVPPSMERSWRQKTCCVGRCQFLLEGNAFQWAFLYCLEAPKQNLC